MRSLILIVIPYTISYVKSLFKHLLRKTSKTLEINEIPNYDHDEGCLRYLKNNPNSDGFWKGGSGEEFELRYVSAPFEPVFSKFWIWANPFCMLLSIGGRA